MGWSIVLMLVGVGALIVGADLAVGAGRRIARNFGVSELLIGLTITSIGTSLPELATSAAAAIASGGEAGVQAAEVALGNILGSNLFLLSALLGVSGLLSPLAIERRSVLRDGTAIGLAMLALLLVSLSGDIGRVEGIGLIIGYVLYLVITIRQERLAHQAVQPAPPPAPTAREVSGQPGPTLAPADLSDEIAEAIAAGTAELPSSDEPPTEETPPETVTPGVEVPTDWRRDILWLLAGMVVVLVAADVVVDNGVEMALGFGLSGTLVGVLVGVGTSLPEIVVSAQAAWRGATDISVGNLLGSAVTNVFLCLGAAALAHPLPVPELVLRFDWVYTAAVSLIAILLMYEQRDLTRAEGGALVTLFALYLYLRAGVI